MKYFLIAGEASGDMHAAALITALREHDVQASFVGLGGDKMQAAGCHLYQHYNKMAYMGYVAVLAHLKDIRRNILITHQALLHEQPDEVILIDYPGFNLRMAAFCRKHLPHAHITYYIPPKIWAWKRWRVHSIGRYCHRILGIFPFEPNFYAAYGYTCTYVGNPTVEAIDRYRKSEDLSQEPTSNGAYIALLPGSRRHEIANCLPKMLAAASRISQEIPEIKRIIVTTAPGVDASVYAPLVRDYPTAELSSNTYEVIRHARAAVVNSGTATLETALLGCPQTAVYHVAFGHVLNLLRPILFQIPHFTLVNIVAGREVIKELLAYEFTEETVYKELYRLLTDKEYVRQMSAGYNHVAQILGTQRAAQTAAQLITSKQ